MKTYYFEIHDEESCCGDGLFNVPAKLAQVEDAAAKLEGGEGNHEAAYGYLKSKAIEYSEGEERAYTLKLWHLEPPEIDLPVIQQWKWNRVPLSKDKEEIITEEYADTDG